MNKIYIIPREGLHVPDPELKDHLPPEGRTVPDSPYWRRRLRDKEVSVGDLEAIKAAAEAKTLLAAIKADEARKAEEARAAEEAKAAEEAGAAEEAKPAEETASKNKNPKKAPAGKEAENK